MALGGLTGSVCGLIRTDLSKLQSCAVLKAVIVLRAKDLKKSLNFKECAGQPTGACGALSQGQREAEAGGTVGVLKVLPTFVTLDVGLPALPTAQATGQTHTHTHRRCQPEKPAPGLDLASGRRMNKNRKLRCARRAGNRETLRPRRSRGRQPTPAPGRSPRPAPGRDVSKN